jgi:hypothetical protein
VFVQDDFMRYSIIFIHIYKICGTDQVFTGGAMNLTSLESQVALFKNAQIIIGLLAVIRVQAMR